MPLVTRLHPARNDRQIAEAVIADADSLNALSAEIVADFLVTIQRWRHDDNIAAIVVRGDGDRHFCAGGNIRQLYHAIRAADWHAITTFFQNEYMLDAALHHCRKPLIGWATGATMGGGMGVFQGCNIRLVSGKLKMAMPETQIGLFPDVGAAFFFRRYAPVIGFFCGLTGVTLNAADAKFAGLADFIHADNGWDALLAALTEVDWQDDDEANTALVYRLAAALATDAELPSPLQQAAATIEACCALAALSDILEALSDSDDEYTRAAIMRLQTASPAATVFWHRHWQALQNATIEETLAADYRAIMAFCRDSRPQALGELAEGVRALIIDKDKKPRWRFSRYEEVTDDWLTFYQEDEAAAALLREKLTVNSRQ